MAALAIALLCSPSFADAQASAQATAEEAFSAGTTAFASGRYSEAAESFTRVSTDASSPARAEKAAYLLGVALFQAGSLQDAVAALQHFQARFPRSPLGPRADYWLGAANLALGKYAQALASFTSARFRGGDSDIFHASTQLLTGRALEGLGQEAEAESWYQQVLADPAASATAAEAGYRLASARMRSGDFGAARGLLARVVLLGSRSPFVAESLFSLAECELALGNPAEAEKRYGTLVSVYPGSPHVEAAEYRLAECAWRAGSPASALNRIALYLAAFPAGSYRGAALRMRADIAASEQRRSDAVVDYVAAAPLLAQPLDRQAAFYAAGNAELALGRSVEAAESFRRAAEEGGDPALAERSGFQRALILAGTGREREAAATIEGLRAAYPASGHAEEEQRLLALLFERLGDTAGAVSRWDSFVALFPKSASLAEALFHRGVQMLQLGQGASAMDDFQRVMRDFPDTPWRWECTYAVGYAYAVRGEYPRALPYFQSAAQGDVSGAAAARSRLAAGICFYDMGSFQSAASQFVSLAVEPEAAVSPGTARLYAGHSLYRLERLDAAAVQFAESARLLRQEGSLQAAEALWWLAWSTLRLGRYIEARDAFLSVAHGFPADTRALEALYRAGLCETLRHDDTAAVALFNEVLGTGQGASVGGIREQGLYEKGWALARLGNKPGSAAAFDQLAREFPGGRMAATALFKSAENALDAGSFDEARRGFERVTRDFPHSLEAVPSFYWAGEAARQAGDQRGALDLFWDCMSAGADAGLLDLTVEAFRSALLATADPAVGREFADRARSTLGLSADAVAGVQLGYAELLLPSSPSDALGLIQQVRAGAPSEPLAGEASLLVGRYYALTGDWQRAAVVFSALSASRTDEVGARAALQRGLAMEALGRTSEAVDALLRIGAQFPGFDDVSAEALWNAERVSLARGDLARAASIEQMLKTRYPKSPWIRQEPQRRATRSAGPGRYPL